jgi:hypothetical protein
MFAVFTDAFVKKERLLVKGEGQDLARVLPMTMLERMIASEALSPRRLTVLRDGDVIPASEFRAADGRVRADALAALERQGVSFVIAHIQDDVPEVGAMANAIAKQVGHTVWVNAYVTHRQGGALLPHYDDHDVLVLQVHGTKHWFSHGTPIPLPIERSPDGVDFGPPSWDAVLEPRDVLFMPRGEVHHAEVLGDLSVHLTFGIDTLRGVDFAESIVAGLGSELLFREDLTRAAGEAALRERERALKARLHELIDAADVSAFLEATGPDRRSR